MKPILQIIVIIGATFLLSGCETGICDPNNWSGAPLGYGPYLFPFCS